TATSQLRAYALPVWSFRSFAESRPSVTWKLLELLADRLRAAEHRYASGGAAVDAASDAELVSRCRAGDQAAWEALVDRYGRYVHAIVARVYRLDPHDAEDVFQEVFARVFERRATPPPRRAPRAL